MKEARGKSKIRQLGVEESIIQLIATCSSLNLPFALYRLPGEERIFHFQTSLSSVRKIHEINLEEMGKGFLMSEFDGHKYYMRADICWQSEHRELMIRETLDETDLLDQFFDQFNRDTNTHIKLPKKQAGSTEKTDANFLQLVRNCIDEINNGHFDKIVPARAHLIPQQDESQVVESFIKLCRVYPTAFVSVFASGETGSWMGATPEVLVQTKGARYFETVALAGTQLYTGQDLRSVAWTQKEIEEQAMVSRYIINAFKRIRLREFVELGPKTVVAGNLLHLKTIFRVDMQTTNFSELGSVMLKLLHPTSAVCGMPREESLKFLASQEQLDRRYYSGFLGPVNVDSRTDLFVNLRCLEFVDEGVKLYAGAGVTADSVPEKELEETEFKFDTLRKILLS